MIDTLIHFGLFGLFLFGWWVLMEPVFAPTVDRMQFRMKRNLQKEVADSSKFIQVISDLLELSINKNTVRDVYTFLFTVVVLWFLVFMGLLTNNFTFLTALSWSLLIPFTIFLYLNFKGYSNRVAISFEGLDIVNELTNNYRIHHKNLLEAIDQTVISIGDKAPLSRKMLLNMSYRVRDAQNEEDVQKALDQMVFLMQVSWSKQLANLFKIAFVKGEDITQGLLDITTDLGELEQMSEKKKQLNLEGTMMLVGLLPIMIAAGFYFIFGLADFTLTKYLSYQLKHPIGFRFFFFSVFAILVSVILHMYFSKSKNDF